MARTRRSGSGARPTRAPRPRPTPRWLLKQADLDEIARARVLMVLSVLSGERAVSTAIQELQISRGFYYQLETKALNAMLLALQPGSDGSASPDATGMTRRIEALEAQVSRLERDKRRAERLLLLTRKTIRPAPVKTAAGRPPKPRGSTSAGPARWPGSGKKATVAATTGTAASIPTTAGGNEGR